MIKNLIISILAFGLAGIAKGQRLSAAKMLRGKVVSSAGDLPVEGASISLQKSGSSAVSSSNGSFTIPLLYATDSLLVSFTGYQTLSKIVSAADNGEISAMMTATVAELENVDISTGYQYIPKERATGSFSQVNNTLLNRQVGSHILDRLNGVASGVLFPGKLDGPELSVRGLSTINGNKMPLIVVDNFPYEGDINNINPNEIENVSILKDAAATSIWGTRASNGVIVITTKKGKPDQPMKVAFNTNVILSKKPNLFYLPQLTSSDYIDFELLLYAKGYYNNEISSFDHKPLSPVIDLLALRDAGGISSSAAEAAIDKMRQHDVRNDYAKYMYRPACNQQYALNLQGGTGRLAYYLSSGYDNNIGELHQLYERWNIRSENNYRLRPGLELTAGFAYTGSYNKSGRPGYNNVLVGSRRIPYLSFTDDSGNPIAVAKDYRTAYTDTVGGGKLFNWKYYPLEEYRQNFTEINASHLLAKTGLNWLILPGLCAQLLYQYEQQQTQSGNLQEPDSYAARNMVNRFSQLNYGTGGVIYGLPPGGILSSSAGKTAVHNVRIQASYTKHWQRHSIATIAGWETRAIHTNSMSVAAYGYDNATLLAAHIDYLNRYPILTNGARENIPDNFSRSEHLNRFVSGYGNASYTYINRYTLSFSGRKDASNIFGVNTNDKWNPLWSAGLGWEISKEGFFHLRPVRFLKLRATYGFSGNMDPNRAAVTTLIYGGPDVYTNLRYAQVDQFANPDLRWEKTRTINLGIDLAAFNDRLSCSIDYYFKRSSDLFGPALVDYTAGLNRSSLIINAASVKGTGVDLQLNGSIIDQKQFGWQSTWLFSFNKNITDSFYRASSYAAQFIRDGGTISAIKGKALYSVVSYAWQGLDEQGNPRGMLDNKPSKDYTAIMNNRDGMASLIYSGPALPLYFGNWSNTLRYKSFSLTANISYKLAYYYRRQSINYENLLRIGEGNPDYILRWQKPGDETITNVPAFVYPLVNNRDLFYNQAAVNVHRADNIRLQFVDLRFDFHAGKRSRHFQFYFNAANLGILWQKDKGGPDPDFSNVVPPLKTFCIGGTATF